MKKYEKSSRLRRCPFWCPPFGPGGLALAKRRKVVRSLSTQDSMIFESTWEKAIEQLSYQWKDRTSKIVQRLLEETEKILKSSHFKSEWNDFIASMPAPHHEFSVIDRLLEDKSTEKRLKGIYRDWGLSQMNGWWPVVVYTPLSMSQRQIHRCNTCGRRHYQKSDWPLELRTLNKIVKCCEEPSLRPLKVEIHVEFYQEMSRTEWGDVKKRMGYRGLDYAMLDKERGAVRGLWLPVYQPDERKQELPSPTRWQQEEMEQSALRWHRTFKKMLSRMKKGQSLPLSFEQRIHENIRLAHDAGYGCPESFDKSRPTSEYLLPLVQLAIQSAYDIHFEKETVEGWIYRN